MSHLLRSHAPVTEAGWEQLDAEARQRLVPALAARKLVDFSGPLGWGHSATNLGRTPPTWRAPAMAWRHGGVPSCPWWSCGPTSPCHGPTCSTPTAGPTTSSWARSTRPPAASPTPRTWRSSTDGRRPASPASPKPRPTPRSPWAPTTPTTPPGWPGPSRSCATPGSSGPYGLALGPDGYRGVVETTEHGGLIVFDHLRQILDGPIVWSPGVTGAVVVSLRGGDFVFESGQDLSIGYSHHDGDVVHLYLEESFSFRVASPDAAVTLGA